MTTAICFSKNRACQLDLLLRSIEANAPDLFDEITVIWKGDDALYVAGYRDCQDEHPKVSFVEERDLRAQTLELVDYADQCVTTFCDDDVVYRPMGEYAEVWFLRHPDVVCLSLRLGAHTTYCYSLARTQRVPVEHWEGVATWSWPEQECDFAYPGSLDAHLWRSDEFIEFIDGGTWRTPNQLEEHLQGAMQRSARGRPMAALEESCVVGLPLNLVNETHPNRHGVVYARSVGELNREFLSGRRLDLGSVNAGAVHSAHTEMDLRWLPVD